MSLKDEIILKIRGIDKINEDILFLQNSKKELYKDVADIKLELVNLHNQFIGRKALLTKEDGTQEYGTCSLVKIGNNLEIIHLFSYGNKKIKGIISYDWKK